MAKNNNIHILSKNKIHKIKCIRLTKVVHINEQEISIKYSRLSVCSIFVRLDLKLCKL